MKRVLQKKRLPRVLAAAMAPARLLVGVPVRLAKVAVDRLPRCALVSTAAPLMLLAVPPLLEQRYLSTQKPWRMLPPL